MVADCVRLEGAEGAVKTDNGEEEVEPYWFTEMTIIEYVVPPTSSVKVADVEVSDEGITGEPSRVKV